MRKVRHRPGIPSLRPSLDGRASSWPFSSPSHVKAHRVASGGGVRGGGGERGAGARDERGAFKTGGGGGLRGRKGGIHDRDGGRGGTERGCANALEGADERT